MNVRLPYFLRGCFVFGALCGVQVSQAAITQAGPSAAKSGNSFVIQYASNGTPIASASRSVTSGATSGEMLIRDMLNISGPAGNLPVTVQRATTAAEVAGSIARGFVKGLGVVGIGVMAYDLVTGIRARMNGSMAEVDVGTSAVDKVVENWCVSGQNDSQGNPKYCAASAPAAWDLYWSSRSHTVGCGTNTQGVEVQGSITYVLRSIHSSGTAYYYDERWVCNGPTRFFDSLYSAGMVDKRANVTQKTCPGGGSVGVDGKCPTGVYTPLTEVQLRDLIKSAVTTAIADQHLRSPAASAVETAPMTVTGPATQVGTATTAATTADGKTTTQTTTPTYQYNYSGDTITYNTTNNTSTSVVNNTTGVTESTSTQTKPETSIPGLCDLFPTISACQKLDNPEDSSNVPSQPWTPSITPHVFSSSATCPSPITISFPRVSFVMVWDPLCNLASTFLAPIVTVLSMFAAAKVFFSGFRV